MSLRSLFLFLQGPSLAFTHHWGSEKGRTSRQVCKGGGKLVFSQGSTHTGREPMLPVLTHEFRNHSDVWFVRHRVGRGVLFVNRNYDLPLARHGHRKSSPPRPAKKTNGLHAWNLGFFTFFFFKHLSPAVWLKTPWHPLVYYSLTWKRENLPVKIVCRLSLDCVSASCAPLRFCHEELVGYPPLPPQTRADTHFSL